MLTPKDLWTPVNKEELVCVQENGNPHELYLVAVKNCSLVVGHVARKSSADCSLFLQTGTNAVTVRDSGQYFIDQLAIQRITEFQAICQCFSCKNFQLFNSSKISSLNFCTVQYTVMFIVYYSFILLLGLHHYPKVTCAVLISHVTSESIEQECFHGINNWCELLVNV